MESIGLHEDAGPGLLLCRGDSIVGGGQGGVGRVNDHNYDGMKKERVSEPP